MRLFESKKKGNDSVQFFWFKRGFKALRHNTGCEAGNEVSPRIKDRLADIIFSRIACNPVASTESQVI